MKSLREEIIKPQDLASYRNKLAMKLTDDEIYYQTVRQALTVEGAEISDKLVFALSGLPNVMTNFEETKKYFCKIVSALTEKNIIPETEKQELLSRIDRLSSYNQLMTEDSYLMEV